MIDSNNINKILNIKESYELPERLMELLMGGNASDLFEKFLKLESDLSFDWFTDYFQEEHSNRNNMMQDFTPKEVARLLPMLEGNYNSVADICCGTGGLTIAAWNHNKHATFYCEELSTRAFPLLLFNLAIRNINAIAVNKDVLENKVYAAYKINNMKITKLDSVPNIEKVDFIVTNPPYSVKWKYDEKQNDIRFRGYGYPPTQFADYGFVLHGLSLLKKEGKMCAILPHGVLFRGSKEEIIRRKLIDNNRIISVIGLPQKLFKNTGIPTCVCVYGNNDSGNVLFIDAQKECIKGTKQNQLSTENLEKISETYKNRTEHDKYSHIADKAELEENGYNLNIPRYVDTFEPEELPDLSDIVQELAELEVEIYQSQKDLIRQMKRLTSPDVKKKHELKKSIKILEEAIDKHDVQLKLEL